MACDGGCVGGVSHARMEGGRRTPRCWGGGAVLLCPIDWRLRRCVLSGTRHLFVVVRRWSCVVSGASGAATSGGVMRAGAVHARRSAMCVRVLRSTVQCGCDWCCGGGFAATLAVHHGALVRRGASEVAAFARARRKGAFLFSCKRGAVPRRKQCACGPLFLCSRCRWCC